MSEISSSSSSGTESVNTSEVSSGSGSTCSSTETTSGHSGEISSSTDSVRESSTGETYASNEAGSSETGSNETTSSETEVGDDSSTIPETSFQSNDTVNNTQETGYDSTSEVSSDGNTTDSSDKTTSENGEGIGAETKSNNETGSAETNSSSETGVKGTEIGDGSSQQKETSSQFANETRSSQGTENVNASEVSSDNDVSSVSDETNSDYGEENSSETGNDSNSVSGETYSSSETGRKETESRDGVSEQHEMSSQFDDETKSTHDTENDSFSEMHSDVDTNNSSFGTFSNQGGELSSEKASESGEIETEYENDLLDQREVSLQFNDELKSTQEIANEAYEQTKKDMVQEYGYAMSNEQLERLKTVDAAERVHVISPSEYVEAFPKIDFNVVGHCDAEGNIYLKDSSEERVNHVTTHEAMHYSANREIVYDEQTGEKTVISGVRENKISRDNEIISITNQGVNEGMTEMYTLRELKSRGDSEAAEAITSYRDAREWSERMESLVGEEYYEGAYFGNNRENLEREFNRLNDNSNAWREYSRDVDILTYSEDMEKVEEAEHRIMDKYVNMLNKTIREQRG